jgi:hypothetical protein
LSFDTAGLDDWKAIQQVAENRLLGHRPDCPYYGKEEAKP